MAGSRQWGKGSIFKPANSRFYYVKYTDKLGHEHCVTSKCLKKADAAAFLRQKLSDPAVDRPVGELTVADLCEFVRDLYVLQGRERSLRWLKDVIGRVTTAVGAVKVVDLDQSWFERYKSLRKGQLTKRGTPPSNGTINRELSLIHRGLTRARELGKLAVVPGVRKLEERNIRRGFFELAQFEAIKQALPEELQPLMTAAYITGWRTQSELLNRQWRHVNFQQNVLRLEPGETKERDGREFPLILGLKEVLESQLARKKQLERAHGIVIPWVFFRYGPGKRTGQRIRSYRQAWRRATEASGVHRVPHDFRRTAVRRMEQAGIPRTVAMRLVGHKTESIYRRYAIVDDKMMRAAGQQLESAFANEKDAVVVAFAGSATASTPR